MLDFAEAFATFAGHRRGCWYDELMLLTSYLIVLWLYWLICSLCVNVNVLLNCFFFILTIMLHWECRRCEQLIIDLFIQATIGIDFLSKTMYHEDRTVSYRNLIFSLRTSICNLELSACYCTDSWENCDTDWLASRRSCWLVAISML